jgi:hypothetical protein
MNTEKELDLTKFNELDQNIIQIVLSEPCISNTDLGERLGKTRQTISTHRNSEAVQAVLNEVRESDIDRFMELRKQALERSELLMKSDDEKVAASICKEFLKSIVPTEINVNGTQSITFNHKPVENIESAEDE